MANQPWSALEKEYFLKNYESGNIKDIADKLGKSEDVIYKRGSLLGLQRKEHENWKSDDDEYLKANFPKGDLTEIATFLKRTLNAVNKRASDLRVKREREYEGTWSDDQENMLKKLYPQTDNQIIAELLIKTESAIENKAIKFKLRKAKWFWKIGQEKYVLENYGKLPIDDMINHLEKTKWSIINKFRELSGLRKTGVKTIISKVINNT